MGGHAGFVVCGECEDGWVYPAPHGVDATDCPAFYDICRCEGTPCPSCRGSGLVPTDELREKATDTLLHVLYLGADRSQLGSTQVRMHERAADAVLRLVAETIGGNR